MTSNPVQHLSISELPPAPTFEIEVGEFQNNYVSPFGKSYLLNKKATIKSKKTYWLKSFNQYVHHYVDINTTDKEELYCVSTFVHNSSLFVKGLDQAIDMARRILAAMDEPNISIHS